MHKVKYEVMYIGKIHGIDTYAGTTECPLKGPIGTRLVGSNGCVACKHHDSMDGGKFYVFCKNPKELKCQ